MHARTLSKIIAVCACLALSVLLLAVSVAEHTAETSVKPDSPVIFTDPASAPHAVAGKGVLANAKKKRATRKPSIVLAAVYSEPKKPEPALLPIVQHPDITAHHQQLADTVLRALPPHCRTYLKNFYIRYKDVKQRGLGGKTTIIIDGTVPDSELVGLLIHECGHVTHANLLGNPKSGKSVFHDGGEVFYNDSPIVAFFSISWSKEDVLKKGMKKEDFASGYGQSDAFEDFSESFALYALHRDAFEARAKDNAAMAAKLAWMETYLPMNENALGQSAYGWDKKVPWDVTRLGYTLK